MFIFKSYNSYKTKVISEINEKILKNSNKLIKPTSTRVIKQSLKKIKVYVRE